MKTRSLLNVVCILVVASCRCRAEATGDHYTAAVVEVQPKMASTNDSNFEEVIRTNLLSYQKAAAEAAGWGADIVVFPAGTITCWKFEDFPEESQKYAEIIPDPAKNPDINPCTKPSPDHPILTNLSCLAKNNKIYVVAEMDEKVPKDSRANETNLYGATVVFDNTGKLIARHRDREPDNEGFTNPKVFDASVFETPFGTFGVVSGDEPFYEESVKFVEKTKVENVVWTTWWEEELPLSNSLQFFQGWSLVHKVNLLVANAHVPENSTMGSLISSGKHGAINYTYDDGEQTPKVVIAKIPRKDTYIPKFLEPSDASLEKLSYIPDDTGNYTKVELKDKEGTAEACNNGLCCKLTYKTDQVPKNFTLMAYKGVSNGDVSNGTAVCQEVCLLTVCDANCSECSVYSTVAFESASITSNMETKYQYPIAATDDMRLVRGDDLVLSPGTIGFASGKVKRPLVSLGIHGRCYEKDSVVWS